MVVGLSSSLIRFNWCITWWSLLFVFVVADGFVVVVVRWCSSLPVKVCLRSHRLVSTRCSLLFVFLLAYCKAF